MYVDKQACVWAVFTTFNFARRPRFSRLGVLISQIKTAGYLYNITMTKMQPTDRGRSFVYDTIAEAAVTHISYVNKSNRLYKQHHRDKNAIDWTWVYIFGKIGAVSFTILLLRQLWASIYYRNKSNRVHKQHYHDKKAIKWMWCVYFKGYAGPPSTLPASVNTWRPTIAKLIDCDRLYAIRALLYYSYSDCERN